MARLAHYLPPFASDYTGACAALFAADCLTVLVDASCCTRTYVEYDESRWDGRKSGALSAQLRHIEAITGDDRRIVEQARAIVERYRPGFFALVGTPVPALVGLDLDGIASEVELLTGTPCMAVPTTGFASYEQGMARALERLVERFALGMPAARAEPAPSSEDACRDVGASLCANVFGTNPLDVAGMAPGAVARGLSEAGVGVVCDAPDSYGRSSLALAPSADATLVTSVAGLPAARLLERRCGVPFACGFPLGADGPARVAELLGRAAQRRREDAGGDAPTPSTRDSCPEPPEPAALVLGDQVFANSLRASMRACGLTAPVAVGTFFMRDAALSETGDIGFRGEGDLAGWLARHPRCVVVGDPLLARLPQTQDRTFVPLVHPAISSRLHRDHAPTLSGREGQAWIERACDVIATERERHAE